MTQSEEMDRIKEATGEGPGRYLRPSECRSHMRRVLAKEFEGIVAGFVAAAKKGSCPHVKLATELLQPLRKGPSKKKGSATRYLEQLEREDRERERLQKEQLGEK